MENDIEFEWLINMDYEHAQEKILEHKPYYLYPYYMDGKNYMYTTNIDTNRIHVRVENGIIINVNGCG